VHGQHAGISRLRGHAAPIFFAVLFFFSEKLLLGSLLTLSGSGSFHHMAIVCLLLKKKDCLFTQDASACTCLWARPSRRQAVNSLPCVGRVHAPGDLPSESETHSFSEPFGLYQRSQQPHWVRHFFLPSRPRIYYIYISVMLVDAVQCHALCGHGAARAGTGARAHGGGREARRNCAVVLLAWA